MSPLVSTTIVSYQPSPGSSRAITTWPGAISSQSLGRSFWPFGDEGVVEPLAAAACDDAWSPGIEKAPDEGALWVCGIGARNRLLGTMNDFGRLLRSSENKL